MTTVLELAFTFSYWWGAAIVIFVLLVALVLHDVFQRKHTILRNFPVLGRFRFALEKIGPELRQYIVARNDEEQPFTRDQRSWVYASSKNENNTFGFGTDNNLETSTGYIILKQSAFPIDVTSPDQADYPVACLKKMGEARGRKRPFQMPSIVNVSAMSFGSLGKAAVQAINQGCKIAGCYQNTGEGGISPYHLSGSDLVWQIGTGYFACRDEKGNFSLTKLKETVATYPQIKALEIKLSQGAKPGAGGLLPKEKISVEIAQIRGISRDQDCVSPSCHRAFSGVDEMLDFVETLAEATGLPVGIKSAVGQGAFWRDLARLMQRGNRGVDFITVDGGEGGTGAAPLVYSDHVSLPFKIGFSRVHQLFLEAGLNEKIVFIGSGKLGFPEQAMLAFALGCDAINVAREAMLSIGCIQAQSCHTNHCPAGVATNHPWLMRGLDPTLKSARLANYIITLRKELLKIGRSLGFTHPTMIGPECIEILDANFSSRPLREVFNGRWKE